MPETEVVQGCQIYEGKEEIVLKSDDQVFSLVAIIVASHACGSTQNGSGS